MAHTGSRCPLTASPPIVSNSSSPGTGSAAQSSATAMKTTRYPCASTRPARVSKLIVGQIEQAEYQPYRASKSDTYERPDQNAGPATGQELSGSGRGSALHSAGGEARDVVVEEPDVDGDDRHAGQDGARHQRAPVIDVAPDEVRGHAHHRRLVAALRHECE